MPITEQQLLQIMPKARPVVGAFLPALNRAMTRWRINTLVRQAAFLAQIGHESGQLRSLVENLNYSAESLVRTWPSRFTSQTAPGYARQPEKIANKVYGGRMGNGSEASGDGWRFRGRGLLQVTGRDNYREVGAGLGLPLEAEPELLEQAEQAAQSAAWWWAKRGLNEMADAGRIRDIGSIINTGQPGKTPHGAADRLALYDLALRVLA
ncbi:glycoside hydrolase family 19 protein [Pseudomonas sp. p1(2021b)]|uniref:glycoside hydrolase family 19 protein n=1 Tax=Pseudomonas sp. p1(2021b) TaxID=2874628 RepID=UPI001CCB13AD|nr:glycoside hydrolase family 19 protein [Pseudomonas sp. p1(2021b)]UBM23278.1 glycoside hydrolase family 19 protein [Pseudomonas sp. p1(2021b)]UBM27199.1 glycoside hydrolase family 19 protein [Pseudomonas sp. p1(2021b)]